MAMTDTKKSAKRPPPAAKAWMLRLLPGWVAGRPVRRVLVLGTAGLLAASVLGSAPAGAAGMAPHWSIVPSPNSTGVHGVEAANALAGVSCVSARACISVGSYSAGNVSGVSKVLAERWNGRRWAIQAAPSPTSDSSLSAVSCTSARACTAVGNFVTRRGAVSQKTLAERWNGIRWIIQPTPNPNRFNFLSAVSCTSRRACIAVGRTQSGSSLDVTMAERWNGRKWTIMHTRNPRQITYADLTGVSCTSATACTAVGTYLIPGPSGGSRSLMLAERWNGRKWAIQRTPNLASPVLTGVSCTSARACTAVGAHGDPVLGEVALAERWNGTRWAIQAVPTPARESSMYFSAVSCLSRRACTAVGAYYDSVLGQVALAERWNGTTWAIQPIPTPPRLQLPNVDLFITGASCVSAAECAAVGSYVYSQSDISSLRTLAERY